MELYDWAMQILVRRFFTFKIPGTDELIVFVIHYPFESLAFARPGDKAWTEVVEPWPKGSYRPCIHTVMVWDGKVIILYSNTSVDPIRQKCKGRIAYCDITSLVNSDYNPVQAKDYNVIIPRNLVSAERRLSIFQISIEGDMYLTELAGDLLVILRIRECGLVDDDDDTVETTFRWDSKDCYRTVDFKVYKYAPNSTKSWEKVKDLGDFSIFVGDNYATSVHISKAPNCQKNAIYFIDDESKNYWSIKYATEVRGHDMGKFDMTSEEITPFYQGGDIISKYFSPIWFMPNF